MEQRNRKKKTFFTKCFSSFDKKITKITSLPKKKNLSELNDKRSKNKKKTEKLRR